MLWCAQEGPATQGTCAMRAQGMSEVTWSKAWQHPVLATCLAGRQLTRAQLCPYQELHKLNNLIQKCFPQRHIFSLPKIISIVEACQPATPKTDLFMRAQTIPIGSNNSGRSFLPGAHSDHPALHSPSMKTQASNPALHKLPTPHRTYLTISWISKQSRHPWLPSDLVAVLRQFCLQDNGSEGQHI